jgi:hypothetical protein
MFRKDLTSAFRGEAEVGPTAEPAASVENDPLPTCHTSGRRYNLVFGTVKLQALPVAGKSARGRLMQRIADWLEKLGMSEYAERFAEIELISPFFPN